MVQKHIAFMIEASEYGCSFPSVFSFSQSFPGCPYRLICHMTFRINIPDVFPRIKAYVSVSLEGIKISCCTSFLRQNASFHLCTSFCL